MNKAEWKAEIEQQIKFDPDYIPSFKTTIIVLSEILEERDRVHDEYERTGANPTIIFKTDRGSENPKPNPLLKQWNELNTTALAYLRDLGITPAGLRKLQGQLPKHEPKRNFFEEFEQLCNEDEEEKEKPKTDREIREEKAAQMGLSLQEYDRWYQEQYFKKSSGKIPEDSIFADESEDNK